MATSKVVVNVEVDLAHADGLSWQNVHCLAAEGVKEALSRGGYILDRAEITKCKVRSVADAEPNKETRWR